MKGVAYFGQPRQRQGNLEFNDIYYLCDMKEKADIYKQYLQGWAYIPIQDLPIYENAYKEIYGEQ